MKDKRREEAASLRMLFQEQLDHLLTLIEHVEHRLQRRREQAAKISESTEALVSGTNPNVRIVIGYQNRLRKSAGLLTQYIDCLADSSPDIIYFERQHYAEQAVMDTLFQNREDMQLFFSQSQTAKIFFKSPGNRVLKQVYLLITARLKEKTVFGSTTQGSMLRTDVRQTHVSFTRQRMFALSSSEKDLHKIFKKWLLDEIVACIRTQLNAQRKKMAEDLRHQGKKVNRGHADPEKYLTDLQALLEEPHELLYLYTTEMKTDCFGIKITDENKVAARHYTLTQAHIANRKDQAIVLASCSAADVLDA